MKSLQYHLLKARSGVSRVRVFLGLLGVLLPIVSWGAPVDKKRAKALASQVLAELSTPTATLSHTVSFASLDASQQASRTRGVKGVPVREVFLPNNQPQEGATGGKLRGDAAHREAIGYYIFCPEEEEAQGFVIIAADDRWPAVLGYSAESPWQEEHLSPTLVAWFEQIDRMVAQGHHPKHSIAATNALQQEGAIRSERRVAPLLGAIKWDQTEGYNKYTPHNFNGEYAPVGCVATAMAQIMCYHQWPTRTTGDPKHWNSGNEFRYCNHTFGMKEYDYNVMPKAFPKTPEEIEQASSLSWEAAASVEMKFSLNGSSSSEIAPYEAFVRNFGYSKQIRIMYADYYTPAQMEHRMQVELTNGRPMLFTGLTSIYSGHAFVCDGYDGEGAYHINWGWSGIANGYYFLNHLLPHGEQGTGSMTGGGYNLSFSAIVGIMPNRAGVIEGQNWSPRCEKICKYFYNRDPSIALEGLFVLRPDVKVNQEFLLGLAVVTPEGKAQGFFELPNFKSKALDGTKLHVIPLEANNSYVGTKNQPIPFLLKLQSRVEPGRYRVSPVLLRKKTSGEVDTVMVPISRKCSPMFVTVGSDGITVDKIDQVAENVSLEANLVSPNNRLVAGVSNRVKVRVKNTGNVPYSGFIGGMLSSKADARYVSNSSFTPTSSQTLMLEPGDTKIVYFDFDINHDAVSREEQTILHVYYDPENGLGTRDQSGRPLIFEERLCSAPVTLCPPIALNNIRVPDGEVTVVTPTVPSKGVVTMKVNLSLPGGEKGYKGKVCPYFFDEQGNELVGMNEFADAEAEMVVLLGGESIEFTIDKSVHELPNGRYTVKMRCVYYDVLERLQSAPLKSVSGSVASFDFTISGEYTPPRAMPNEDLIGFDAEVTPVLAEHERVGLRVAPNPVQGTMRVHYPEGVEPVRVELLDVWGRAVRVQACAPAQSESCVVWSVEGVPAGFYYVRLLDTKGHTMHCRVWVTH